MQGRDPSPSKLVRESGNWIPLGADRLGRLGAFEVRLSRDPGDVEKAQRLRYEVFHEELAARAGTPGRIARLDVDRYDPLCDHLLVVEWGADGGEEAIATTRLLSQAAARDGFWSESEFDIAPLLRRHPGSRFLEVGRSCVRAGHRGRRTIELLWHGIWTYVLRHRCDVLFGCASFSGTDPEAHAPALTFLHHHVRAQGALAVAARPECRRAMDILPLDGIDARGAMRAMPPLLKGYLRLGARIGDGAVVDEAFGTTDVFVVLPVAAIDRRYIDYFGASATRHAA